MNDGTTATGVSFVDQAVVWSIAAAALITAAGLLWRGTRGFRSMARRIEAFADDWGGCPERPGVPGRPGVMERLDGIERQTQHIPELEQRLARIEHEMRPNSGASLRDAVDRLDVRTRQAIPASGE